MIRTLQNRFVAGFMVLFAAVAMAMPAQVSATTLSYTQVASVIASVDQLRASNSEAEIVRYLENLLAQLVAQINNYSSSNNFSSNNDDEPDVDTDDVDDIERTTAELNGSVDMNDFRNGLVFFLWGEDEDELEDAEDEDEYNDIRERGDDLQKQRVDSDLDDDDDYSLDIRSLDEDTRYYYTICVEYEDEDDDETIDCGTIDDFRTDDRNNSSNDDEPEVDLDNTEDIEDDSAELNGSVDMNDFSDGIVFFLWGEDEEEVEDAVKEDSYDDINEEGDDLQKERVDNDLDGDDDYSLDIDGLDDDTEYYIALCVEYIDEDDDETLECDDIDDFRTDD